MSSMGLDTVCAMVMWLSLRMGQSRKGCTQLKAGSVKSPCWEDGSLWTVVAEYGGMLDTNCPT